jgi:ABC-type Mn2+/Zn2+ transport system permease subunit
MGLAAAIGAVAGVAGIAASAQWGIAGGAAITLAATAFLGVSLAAGPVRRSR